MTETPTAVKPPSAWRLWENPIFLRYGRSRLRKRGLVPPLIIFVVLAAFAYLITPMAFRRFDEGRMQLKAYLEEQAAKNPAAQRNLETFLQFTHPKIHSDQVYQRMAIIPLLGIQALILFLMGTGQVAGGMTTERDEGMVDYQRLTPISPIAKVLGYLFGLPVREWVLFFATGPFMLLALWRGEVPISTWGPSALIFFTSVILYHFTGLVAGTVFKSRRWAFLLSMALIFLLYFLVPQGSRFGLPFLRYVTMWPVLMEAAPHIFPPEPVRDWQIMSAHIGGAGVDFFDSNFSDLAFTLIVQGSFILTMLVMVWRKWRQADSHLLSKGWSLLVFAWLCILPIGNALPGIRDGSLFPVHDMRTLMRTPLGAAFPTGEPRPEHAFQMCAFYGAVMLIFLILLVIMLTPAQDSQARGLRRAAKLKRRSAPFFADESSAFLVVLILTAGGAASWAWFTRSVLQAKWFHADPGSDTFLVYFGVLAPAIMGFHALLEARGGKWPFLAVVFLGAVPILTSLVLATASRDVPSTAVMVAGASPLAQTVYGAESFMPWHGLRASTVQLHDTIRYALVIWPAIYAIAAAVFIVALRRHWKRRRA